MDIQAQFAYIFILYTLVQAPSFGHDCEICVFLSVYLLANLTSFTVGDSGPCKRTYIYIYNVFVTSGASYPSEK